MQERDEPLRMPNASPPTPTPHSTAPIESQHAQWARRIGTLQVSRLTEAERAALREKADRSALVLVEAQKAKCVQKRSQTSISNSMEFIQRSEQWSVAEQPLRRQEALAIMAATDEALESEMHELVANAQASRSGASHTPTPAAQAILVDGASDDEAENVAEASAASRKALLKSLRTQPSSEEECETKFAIYDTFSGTVTTLRTELDGLIRSSIQSLEGAPHRSLLQDFLAIDSRRNQGIYDESRYWFVHDMMKQAMANCEQITRVTVKVRQKLNLAATLIQPGCPACLEPFTIPDNDAELRDSAAVPTGSVKPVTLACCHRICATCWDHWVATRGGAANAFCPLCRSREFVAELQRFSAE